MYVENYLMLEDSSLRAKFRTRFWVPYTNYLELLQWIRDNTRFARWCGEKINNNRSSPIQLLVLGSLHYLGWGWTFDDIEEQTAISKEVHCTFFPCLHWFWQYFPLFLVFPHSFAFTWGSIQHARIRGGRISWMHWIDRLHTYHHWEVRVLVKKQSSRGKE